MESFHDTGTKLPGQRYPMREQARGKIHCLDAKIKGQCVQRYKDNVKLVPSPLQGLKVGLRLSQVSGGFSSDEIC